MNPHRGEVSIKLGDTDYTLRPSFEALVEMEKLSGMDLIPLARKVGSGQFGINHLVAVISAAIKAGGGKPPPNIGELLKEFGIVQAGSFAADFLTEALTGGSKNAEAPEEAT